VGGEEGEILIWRGKRGGDQQRAPALPLAPVPLAVEGPEPHLRCAAPAQNLHSAGGVDHSALCSQILPVPAACSGRRDPLIFPGRTHPVSLRERVPVLRPGQQVPAPRRGHTAVRFRRPSCQHNPGPCAACYLSARLWRGLPSGGDDPLIWRVQRDQTEKRFFFLLLFFLRCFFPCHYSQIGERFSGFSSGSKNSRECFASMALGRKKI